MQRFLRRMLNASLAKAFSSWEDMFGERKRMQRFLRRILNLERVQAWNTWQAGVEAVTAQRDLMTRCLQRAVDFQLHAAWGERQPTERAT